ncbi:endothelin-converting enzyme 2-like [Haemaphysalis longicornis]
MDAFLDDSDPPTAFDTPTGLRLESSEEDCLQNAVYLNQLLSWEEVNPCDDFYAFVCQHWTSYSYPSSGTYPVSADDDYVAYLERRLLALLQDESQTTKALQPLQDLYEKCADVGRAGGEGWNSLLELMFNVSLEGFPFTPPVRKSMSVWKAAANILRKTGSSALLSVRIGSHPWANRDVVSVGAPEMLTSGGSVDLNEAAHLYTTAAFSAIRTLRKDFLPPSLALSVVKLATKIEELIMLSPKEDSPVLYNLKSTPELLNFIGEVFRGLNGTPFTGQDSDVLVFTPGVVSGILEIVRKAEAHTVMNYLGVRLMIETSPFLPHANLTDSYGALLYGKRRGILPRWQLCIRVIDRALFPLVVFSLFTDLKLHVSMRRFVDLVYEVIAEFSRGINNSALFEARSKIAIRNLISSIQTRVLGPPWISSGAQVDAFVNNVPTITGARGGLESYVATYEYTFIEALKRASSQRWSRSAFAADCWFEPNPRTIYVPLLVFNVTQAFDNNIDALQLSRVGLRLDRCLFDALITEGNSSNGTTGWLTEDTRSKLQEVEGCFGPHGAQPGLHRVLDSLSAHFAYTHFEKSMKTSDKVLALRLPGGRVLSESQLFFVYLMLQMCEKGDRVSMSSNPFLAGRQLLVALRNGGDFSKVYNCPADSGMNPSRKCAAA